MVFEMSSLQLIVIAALLHQTYSSIGLYDRFGCTPTSVRYGRHTPRGFFSHGQSIDFECNEGYSLRGPSRIKCGLSGWAAPFPFCVRDIRRKCRVPGHVDNGSFGPVKNTYSFGDKIWFSCIAGYTLQGKKDFICQANGNWNGNFPTCQANGCNAPNAPYNGVVKPIKDSFRVNEKVWFACRQGYVLRGRKDLVCQGNGRWSDDEPTCDRQQCDVPNNIDNGSFKPAQKTYFYGNKIKFSCNTGYTLDGQKDFVCQADGNWNGNFPTCAMITCDAPDRPDNGFFIPRKNSFDATEKVKFGCRRGYVLIGNKDLVCQRSGQWSDDEPTCKRRQCGVPDNIDNGSFKPVKKNYFFRNKIWFSCNAGYTLQGKKDFACQADGSWNGNFPTCEEIKCNAPDSPSNGFFRPRKDDYDVNEKVQFRCRSGYVLKGSKDLVCKRNGVWSDDEPSCKRRTCSSPDQPDNGSLKPKKNTYYSGDKVWFSCEAGYTLEGKKDLLCQNNGQWNAEFPICVAIGCNAPSKPDNGFFRPRKDDYDVGAKVSFNCREGYILKGAKDLFCKRGGDWNDDEPICERRQCKVPANVINGSFKPVKETYDVNDKVWFACGAGYTLEGRKDLVCQTNGLWNAAFPTCIRRQCKVPANVINGSFKPVKETYDVNDKVWFACGAGYTLEGQKDLVCQTNGLWNAAFPTCIRRQCKVPANVINGSFKPVKETYDVNDKVWFACGAGYTLEGRKDLVCQTNGLWNAAFPTCIRTTCPVPVRPSNGFFGPVQTTYPVGSKIWFKCAAGYELQGTKDLVCQFGGNWSRNIPTCTSIASCRNKCGVYRRGSACQCDTACISYGNCCKDYRSSCY